MTILVLVLVLPLSQSHNSDRQRVYGSGLSSRGHLLQKVRGGLAEGLHALKPWASSVSRLRPRVLGLLQATTGWGRIIQEEPPRTALRILWPGRWRLRAKTGGSVSTRRVDVEDSLQSDNENWNRWLKAHGGGRGIPGHLQRGCCLWQGKRMTWKASSRFQEVCISRMFQCLARASRYTEAKGLTGTTWHHELWSGCMNGCPRFSSANGPEHSNLRR